MKRNTVSGVALCVMMMMANIGTCAVNPKANQNPSQAGQSSVYFYDVAASGTHGKGKLVLDVNQHTFVFHGQGFTPSSQIELRARAAASIDYIFFASGRATPSGNLRIAGTWGADAAPAEVVTDYITGISALDLYNMGLFIAQLACYYSTDSGVTWHESEHLKDITMGHAGFSDLADLGVPAGALVKIHAVVVGGKDRTGTEVFPTSRRP